jgi:hypothetical protein
MPSTAAAVLKTFKAFFTDLAEGCRLSCKIVSTSMTPPPLS